MGDPVAAAIAFGALGANLLATALLFLFNPRSRQVRWYLPFLCALSAWLLAQGVISVQGSREGAWAIVFVAAVTVLPGLFLASTLADVDTRRWTPWTAVAASLAMVLLGAGIVEGRFDIPGIVWSLWHAAGWGGGAYLHWKRREKHPAATRRRPAHLVVWTLLLVPPLLVGGGMLLGARGFFTYAMPVIVFFIHILVFAGVVWLRFYDIEVRASRSGEVAGRAAQAERLAVVGELAASIAHEVRNPLTGVRSLAQRMAEEEVDEVRWRRYSAVIVEEVDRVDGIVGNLLGLARRGVSGEWDGTPTPLAPLFADLTLLTASRAAAAGVIVRTEAGAVEAPAPRQALASVLLNLLLNAITHSPRGGTVELGARQGEGVEVWVRDEGPGVPSAERERIFEPFHTGLPDGTGLGLSVVRRVSAELGWRVRVEDAPGSGALFRVCIPTSQARREGGIHVQHAASA
jgi:signal transduction histidine kinase